MRERPLFYFRDHSFIESVDEEQRNNFLSENSIYEEKLIKLKDRISKCKYPIREFSSELKKFGEMVLNDLWCLIDNDFPEVKIFESKERFSYEHEIFVQSRSNLFIGRNKYIEAINKHVIGDTPPLILKGDSGIGKSAILAKWTSLYRSKSNEDFFFFTFVEFLLKVQII
ncbi:MAG: hypothetical protein OMM_04567 [Candidatus Magnetoglobus multicellularis str. Araruama]|uniref:Orc1-like AAA ATPase domain-containing protein n=1 Tax=Candidatus Magnetoglobus multicellularis str. Araruama TaxID=890399 RepID=A0A1V1P0Q4_9BACT|nr:MAG: hypothetical protein OMM_04567 [Candidatus Magnetoglobus multicellularis str. Araruama]